MSTPADGYPAQLGPPPPRSLPIEEEEALRRGSIVSVLELRRKIVWQADLLRTLHYPDLRDSRERFPVYDLGCFQRSFEGSNPSERALADHVVAVLESAMMAFNALLGDVYALVCGVQSGSLWMPGVYEWFEFDEPAQFEWINVVLGHLTNDDPVVESGLVFQCVGLLSAAIPAALERVRVRAFAYGLDIPLATTKC